MRYDEKTDALIFSSGRQVCANDGIVGLTIDGQITLYEGYDGRLDTVPSGFSGPTDADKVELADHMIACWQEARRMFAASAPAASRLHDFVKSKHGDFCDIAATDAASASSTRSPGASLIPAAARISDLRHRPLAVSNLRPSYTI
ncbi:hypothetical protein M2171_002430 [Bradyrhizobium japonicum USDA 38]|uniref:hypothetical protein n=1 Tax=Bradyrhizobium japonicum TaxID=375 RepID=UPI00040C8442|nr:hypothetical protein [Bradyrhizobium japonicum]MCS3893297.1 hypothetical protein [Bradyrhizobium japonicum USDA 38]MCS3945811.1 hypothetical protein [Bradyrhizobium japonicum]